MEILAVVLVERRSTTMRGMRGFSKSLCIKQEVQFLYTLVHRKKSLSFLVVGTKFLQRVTNPGPLLLTLAIRLRTF